MSEDKSFQQNNMNWHVHCSGAHSTKNMFFNLVICCGKNYIFFLPKKTHFIPQNGRQGRQDFAQSCPRRWQRLTPKKSVVALKVYHNKWDCGGYIPPLRILRRLYAEESIKKHQKLSKTPEHTKNHQQHPPTNQHVPPIWFQVTFCISDGEKC